MRLRTILAFTIGAAAGYGAAYLGDPDHGQQRRAEAGRWAAQQAVDQARRRGDDAVRAAGSFWVNAVDGYQESRRPV